MLSTAVIVFREILEAALVVSIVLAATTTVIGRRLWIGIGLIGGIAGAGLVAAFANAISSWASGMGQELFNASVMFIAVMMLAWHSVWMGRHGRQITQELNDIGKAVTTGARSLSGLAIVVSIAVLREGSEAVLFLYGIAVSGPDQIEQMLAGAILGIVAGISLGAAMYYGLLKIPVRHLFSVTNALIILLAAGMASQCAGFLLLADLIPAFGDSLWDTSWLLRDTSVPGKMLHTLIGYTARPAGIQVLVYAGTLILIVIMVKKFGQPKLTRLG